MKHPRVILTLLTTCILVVSLASQVGSTGIATGGYRLDTPLPIADFYVGQYSNGSVFAVNGSTWNNFLISTNASYVIQSCINGIPTSGGTIIIGVGHFDIPTKIVVNKNNLALIGQVVSACEWVSSPAEDGTFFDLANNVDGISLELPSGEDHLTGVLIQGIWFDSPWANGGHGITSEFLTAGTHSVKELDIINCAFYHFTGDDAIVLRNPENCRILHCYFYMGGGYDGIYLYGNGYASGNVRIEQNTMWLETTAGTNGIRIETLSSHQFMGVRSYQNHFAAGYSTTVTRWAYRVNATAGQIKGIYSVEDRSERVYPMNITSYDNIYNAETICILDGYWAGGNRTNGVLVDIGQHTTQVLVEENWFTDATGASGVTGIRDANTDSGEPNRFVDNYFVTTNIDTIINATYRAIIEDNVGYNPVGLISSPISSTYLVDAGSGTIANNTAYTVAQSPKTIYMQDADTFDVKVNGQLVFNNVNAATVSLVAGDTFEIEWVSALTTLTVFGE